MDYPVEILPCAGRKNISTLDVQNFELTRFTEETDWWDEINDEIKDPAIANPTLTHLPDLSTSLYGHFRARHNLIKIIKGSDFGNYCKPDANVGVPKHRVDFDIVSARNSWFICISKIFERTAEYTLNGEPLEAKCTIIHTPCAWNYWHFSVRWFLPKENKFWHELSKSDKRKGWSKKALSQKIRSLIKEYATKSPISTRLLDQELFMHQVNINQVRPMQAARSYSDEEE